jgi:hypothetical protein
MEDERGVDCAPAGNRVEASALPFEPAFFRHPAAGDTLAT